jgi:hypothetical protein
MSQARNQKRIKGKDGSIYLGDVKRVGLFKKVKHGQGTITFADGRKYEGEWKEDVFHGRGSYTSPGASYFGEFRNGLRHGIGIFTMSNGYKHEGQYMNGWQHGQGSLVLPDGTKIRGQFYKSLCIGLPKSEVVSIYGAPPHSKQKVTKSGRVEKLLYGKKVGPKRGVSYSMEITVTNDRVSGWRDL